MYSLRRLADLSAPKIAGGYLVFGGLWILLSDAIVNHLFQRPGLITRIQTIKGWVFVLVSALLILALVRTRERQLQHSRDRLSRTSEELHVLHRIFRHNIRNDLNIARGYIDLIRRKIEEADVHRQLDRVHDSTDRILGVSEKLRMIEEADASAANTETVDLMSIIDQEVERLSTEYPDLTISVEGPSRVRIYSDKTLTYVVRELFENAVEHHDGPPEDCRIGVTVEQSVADVTLEIVDNGPGISDYELHALNEGEESQLVHTSGIGLWLVKWLCLFYDSEVTFGHRPEGGTAVTLTFQPALKIEQVIEQAWDEMPLTADS